ncbi:hypothetical protein SFRURICE_016004 [Spodoptera frugiperda]|nr:hypothetical protein SFRURICE_016004 [Spodoptera frugiperda]
MPGSGTVPSNFQPGDNTIFLIHGYLDNSAVQFLDDVRPGLNPTGRHWGAGSQRLRSTDATYVEVIHTDTFGALSNGIGDPIGHVNFYPNGGKNQPGCVFHSCCHARSFELFAASIKEDNRLKGNRCSSMTQMNLNLCRGGLVELGGIDPSKTGESGIYRINTSRRYPFH